MEFLTAPRGDLIRLIYDLIEENKFLKAQIAELKAEKGTPKQDEKKQPPPFIKANVKKKSKKKRKDRSHGFARVADTPTNRVDHALDVCPDCSGPLGKPSVAYTRQVIDIPLPSVEITEHVVYKRWCTSCGKRYYPRIDLGGIVVGKQRIGINLMALVDTLREQFLQPINKIQQYLQMVYRLSLSEGALVRILATTTTLATPHYGAIKQAIRQSSVVYADETGGRENGKNGYHWGFMNQRYKLLLYRKTRASTVVAEVLGSDDEEDAFCGVLVSDFFGSYNEYKGFHQRCWVHLLRDIHDLKEDYPKDRLLKRWANAVQRIYEEAKAYPGPAPNLAIGIQAQERIEKEAYFKEKLKKVSEAYVTQEVVMSVLCSRIMKFLPELFTFVRFPDVESDNNRSERGVRHLVLARKISGGTRSAKGSNIRSVLGSLFGTWRLRGLNPLEQCKLLLANPSCQRV